MSTYAIGDVQGCYEVLQRLLEHIHYDSSVDKLWFVGDLVNRGPDSLKTLQLIHQLPSTSVVLGNHDLHLLAIVYGGVNVKPEDTLDDILKSSQGDVLCDWLVQQPLLHHDAELEFTMVHAGIFPLWDLTYAQQLAKEVEALLQSPGRDALFRNLYGQEPRCWSEELSGGPRWRFIINAFTRMRFCTLEGCLNLEEKGPLAQQKAGELPWFNIPTRRTRQNNIVFGHWAALKGECDAPNTYMIDTGCVWGGSLTALRLEDGERFSVV